MKHKLILFYAFAYAVSWTLWYLIYLRYTEVGAMDLIVLALSIGRAGPIISLAILERSRGIELLGTHAYYITVVTGGVMQPCGGHRWSKSLD